MNFLVCFLLILVTALIVVLSFLWVKFRKTEANLNTQKKMLNNILKTINSVRYGNLHERIKEEEMTMMPNLAQSINSMIDSLADREEMINEYQTELNKKINVLQEVEELKEDFVATLTHDLKVPIMAEKNMLAFLADNRFGELNERQREALLHLKNSNQELVELVEIILETYKLNETKIELTKQKTNANDLLKDTIEEMRPISDSDSIQVNFFTEFDGDVELDRFYIKRVLKNLLLNAISFSEPYSKIDTAVCVDEKHVFLKITNYGKTIKKEEVKHVFDKYYTTAKKFRKVGTGLGLYLSNKIVKAHKGRIMVESQNNDQNPNESWTTFAVVLKK